MKRLLYIAAFLLTLLFPAASNALVDDFVTGELASMLPWEREAIEVDEVEIPGFAAGKGASLSLEMPKRLTGPGKVSFKVEVREKGSPARVFWGSARVRVFKKAVVALRPMKVRTKITADDVKTARVELIEASSSFASVDELSGMVAKRPITAGSVIKREFVRPETVVKRGEKVGLMIEGPSIRIRSHGVATEDGHIGGTIAVRTASGKEVPGQVTGPGEIVISF
ncbi:MAG: flagella basal body P-ring formation protein FlgA [Deltaproteobacteria bacterium GWA2_54_12]|nr:MAG: flagella basal body P-ring formation protein FlgA [Deltaproteobacteria bacterium GWA2_54_12]